MSAPITSGLITISNGAEAGQVISAYNPDFYQRVGFIAVSVATAVCREDGATAGHTNRQSRALQYIANCGDAQAQIQMSLVVLADLSVTISSTSQQIADKLAAQWDTISGN